MIIKGYHGAWPKLHPTARAAENVTLVGDVTLGEHTGLWYGVIARADVAPIVIGARTNIQDGCILHNQAGIPTLIGCGVTAGHGAILHGCTIEDDCLIGMGATLLNGCVIGRGSIVGAGALVTQKMVVPPGSMVMGVPGKVVRPLRPEELEYIRSDARWYVNFAQEELPLIPFPAQHET